MPLLRRPRADGVRRAPVSQRLAAVAATLGLLATGLTAVVTSAVAPTASAAEVVTAVSASNRVENTSTALTWSGSWRTMEGGDSGGSIAYLNSAGSVSLQFQGSGVEWVSRKTASSGIATVTIDGTKVASVDRYSSSTAYQEVVYANYALAEGRHTMTIAWSGDKNRSASDANLIIDAIDVLDDPLTVEGGSVAPTSTGYAVSWNAVEDPSVKRYEVFRRDLASGTRTRAGETTAGTRVLRDDSADTGRRYSYSVIATNEAGRSAESASIATVSASTADEAARYAAALVCPSRTTRTVSTAAELRSALSSVDPGDVVRLAPGTYTGEFTIKNRSSAGQQPIHLCGPRTAVITSGSFRSGSALTVTGTPGVRLVGFSVRDSFKGVTLSGSSRSTVAGLRLTGIGYEAVHLLRQTSDSLVVGNSIARTGLVEAKYGEGIYIGTSNRNWCEYNDCDPDRSDRNALIDNTITDAGAQGIEVKEGTTGGRVIGNRITGTDRIEQYSLSLYMVGGNDYRVEANTAISPPRYGLQTMTTKNGTGNGNVFVGNAVIGTAQYAVWVHSSNEWKTWGTVVRCSNGGGTELANVSCTR